MSAWLPDIFASTIVECHSLKLQQMLFGSGLRAVYITLLRPSARTEIFESTRRGAGPNALTKLRWRFERVKHLYTKYLPPPEILPDRLPSHILEAFHKALESQPPAPIAPRPYHASASEISSKDSPKDSPSPSIPTGPRSSLPAQKPTSSATANTEAKSTEEELRQQVQQLQEKLSTIRRQLQVDQPQSGPSQFQSRILSEAEENFEHERKKRKKLSDSVAGLKEDVREKEQKYKDLRERRRAAEASLLDAKHARDARQSDNLESTKLENAIQSRDSLRKLVEARQKEIEDRVKARQNLERELNELRRETSNAATRVNETSPSGPSVATMIPALIQAFKDLQRLDARYSHGASI